MLRKLIISAALILSCSQVYAESQSQPKGSTFKHYMAHVAPKKTSNYSFGASSTQTFEQRLLSERDDVTILDFSRLDLKTLPSEKIWSRFTKVTYLRLLDCEVRNVSSLDVLKTLKTLRLEDNKISDVAPLASLRYLEELSLSRNKLIDLTPIAGLQYLKRLYVNDNHNTLFAPLPKEDKAVAKQRIDRNNAIIDLLKKKGVIVSK